MKPSPLLILFLTVFWIKGGQPSQDKVFQTPASILVKANSEVTLTLSHKIPSYDTVLWYRRSPGDTALELMAYMYYNNPKYEPRFENRVIIKGNGENTVHLQILNVTDPECTGKYFGAASMHSTKEEGRSRTKTLRDLVLPALVVHQTPEIFFTLPGTEVILQCYHGDGDYPYMLWYQFKSASGAQRAMELIGLLSYSNPNVEKDFQNRFQLTGDAKSRAQLRISNVTSSDSAEYFCAARRHSGSFTPDSLTKSWWAERRSSCTTERRQRLKFAFPCNHACNDRIILTH